MDGLSPLIVSWYSVYHFQIEVIIIIIIALPWIITTLYKDIKKIFTQSYFKEMPLTHFVAGSVNGLS